MKKKSITLIEMLVVMLIIVIISTTVGVSFSLFDRRRLEVAGRSFASDMIRTRQMAVAQRQPYFVVFNLNNNTYDVFNSSIAAANRIKTVNLSVDLAALTFPEVTSATTYNEINLIPAEIMFSAASGEVSRSDGSSISNTGGPFSVPVHVLMANLTWAGRSAAVTFFGETGLVGYKPEFDPSRRRCFIATAAYEDVSAGSQQFKSVKILERFRDRYLSVGSIGRSVIDFYYLVSPPLAQYIGKRQWARHAARFILEPLAGLACQYMGN